MITSDLFWSMNKNVHALQRKTSDVMRARFTMMRKVQPFKEALRDTLLHVCLHAGTPAVMYSGGADSEMLIRELRAINKRPEVHFIRFDDGSNDLDYQQAVEFMKLMDMRMHVHDHSITGFLNSKQHIEFGLKFHTSDVSLITAYKYAEHLGKPILLGPELLLQKHQQDGHVHAEDEWCIIVGEHTTSAEAFTRRTGQPMLGELFFQNSDLLYSVLKMEEVEALVAGKYPGRISMSYVKNQMLEKHLGYEFTAKKKRHGYEPVYQTFRRAVNEVKHALPFIQTEVRVPYRTALDQLEGL